VLTKTDLADPARTGSLRDRLGVMNPGATLLIAPVVPDDLFGGGPFHGTSDPVDIARWLGDEHHHHDGAIASMSLTAEVPLRIDRMVAWIEDTIARHGDRLLRLKGILDIEGSIEPIAVHGVQHVFHPLQKLAAWPEGLRRSRVVLIGRALPETAIADSFATTVCCQRR
jgi:G3E family GTPase